MGRTLLSKVIGNRVDGRNADIHQKTEYLLFKQQILSVKLKQR